MEKVINISGVDVKFKASAALPRLYRIKYRRDIFQDFIKLESKFKDILNSLEENENEQKMNFEKINLPIDFLELFENLAYLMAKHADPTIPEVDEWLEQFDMFSIYLVLPELIELWNLNTETLSNAKKK